MQPTGKMKVSQKAKTRATIWPCNSTLGYRLKKKQTQNANLKRYMHPNVHSSIIYNCQGMEGTKMSINRWMNRDVVCIYVYTHNGVLLSHKKEWKFAFAVTWMGGH